MAPEAAPSDLTYKSPSTFLDAMQYIDGPQIDPGLLHYDSHQPHFESPFKFEKPFESMHPPPSNQLDNYNLDPNQWLHTSELKHMDMSGPDRHLSYDTGYGSHENTPDKSPPNTAVPFSNDLVNAMEPIASASASASASSSSSKPRKRAKAPSKGSKAAAQQDEEPPARKARRSSKLASIGTAQEFTTIIKGEEDDDKREQFLARNREAASKCRQKKKVWTSELEERARILADEKQMLTTYLAMLKNELLMLKCKCLEHSHCGCQGIREYLKNTVTNLRPADKALYGKLSGEEAEQIQAEVSRKQGSLDYGISPRTPSLSGPSLSGDSPGGELEMFVTEDDNVG